MCRLGESFDAQVRSSFAAGDVPDILVGKAQDVKAYVGTGNLAPLPDSCACRIESHALEAVTVGGTPYGLPLNTWYQGVFYNKDIFKDCGIEIPKTLKELEQAAEILEEEGITPFAGHFQESWYLGNTTMQFMMNELFCDALDWGEQFRDGSQNFSDNPSVRRCFENNQYIFNHTWKDARSIDQYECDKRFANGQAAMYLTGAWSMQFTSQYSSRDEFGIFPYPNEKGDAKLLKETNMTWMKSAHTPHDELITKIFQEIIDDGQLLGEILDYTQTQPAVDGLAWDYRSCVQEDIAYYEQENLILDVTAGNNQLVWSFQNDVASEQRLWLEGKKSLADVLQFADDHRRESINGE